MIPPADISRLRRVLCVGAHSDDVEIGCGATVLRLLREVPGVAMRWVVFCGQGVRGEEARASADAAFAGRDGCELVTHDFPDAHLPAHWDEVKQAFATHRDFAPDAIFTHRPDDAHQDHRLLAEVTGQTFRDHLVLGYEVPKYDGDLGQPNVFVPASPADVEAKCRLLDRFASQRDKHWFDDETFKGLMRLRGLECVSPTGYAEGFYCRKLVME